MLTWLAKLALYFFMAGMAILAIAAVIKKDILGFLLFLAMFLGLLGVYRFSVAEKAEENWDQLIGKTRGKPQDRKDD